MVSKARTSAQAAVRSAQEWEIDDLLPLLPADARAEREELQLERELVMLENFMPERELAREYSW